MYQSGNNGTPVPLSVRLLILADIDAGMPQEEACIKYRISGTSIRQYIKLRAEGNLAPKPRAKNKVSSFNPWRPREKVKS